MRREGEILPVGFSNQISKFCIQGSQNFSSPISRISLTPPHSPHHLSSLSRSTLLWTSFDRWYQLTYIIIFLLYPLFSCFLTWRSLNRTRPKVRRRSQPQPWWPVVYLRSSFPPSSVLVLLLFPSPFPLSPFPFPLSPFPFPLSPLPSLLSPLPSPPSFCFSFSSFFFLFFFLTWTDDTRETTSRDERTRGATSDLYNM